MITTVTTTTTTTVTTITAASLALIAVITLILLLINKEVFASSTNEQIRRVSKVLNIAVIPLLIACAVTAVVNILKVLA